MADVDLLLDDLMDHVDDILTDAAAGNDVVNELKFLLAKLDKCRKALAS